METEKSIVKSHNSNQSTTIRKNYILVIGIDDYTHCPKLNNAVKDVKDFIDLITNNFLLDKINIIELYDKDATYEKILDKFKYLVQNVTLYDNVIIYFSGHGELDEVLDEGFWIPVEAEREKENQYIRNSTIHKVLNKINSHHTFLIVDSCYSGSLFLEGKERFVSEVFDKFPSRWGLTSGRNTIVSDGKKGGNSPFAKALLSTLKLHTKPLNISALCDYVKQAVSAATNSNQMPIGDPLSIIGHKGGQMVLFPKNYNLKYPTSFSQESIEFEKNKLFLEEEQLWAISKEINTISGFVEYIENSVLKMHISEANTQMSKIQFERQHIEKNYGKKQKKSEQFDEANKYNFKTHFHFEPEMVYVKVNSEKKINDFFMSKYLITQSQWNAIVKRNPSFFKSDTNLPVDFVSREDINKYIQKLNQVTNRNYRLPTIKEWEYAAIGGLFSNNYSFSGSNESDSVGWFKENSKKESKKVGLLKSNELGIFDMSGNLWEWCQDTFLNEGVLKGGSWDNSAKKCTISSHITALQNEKNITFGFRLFHAF